MNRNRRAVIFPPGVYYIGDPCYVIPDEEWMDYLDTYPTHPDPMRGWVDEIQVDYKGYPCWHASTAYGDGGYFDQHRDCEYSVDAGIIGVIPIELCSKQDHEFEELGRVHTFEHPFEVYVDDNSVFHIGEFMIDTDPSYEEEDEDEDSCCDYCGDYDCDGDCEEYN
jgi:hypothetical protein